MLFKVIYFLYSDEWKFRLLSEYEKSLFINKIIEKNKIALKYCFFISVVIVILSFYLNGV